MSAEKGEPGKGMSIGCGSCPAAAACSANDPSQLRHSINRQPPGKDICQEQAMKQLGMQKQHPATTNKSNCPACDKRVSKQCQHVQRLRDLVQDKAKQILRQCQETHSNYPP